MRRNQGHVLFAFFSFGILAGCGGGEQASSTKSITTTTTTTNTTTTTLPTVAAIKQQNYSTSITPSVSKSIIASTGGIVESINNPAMLSGKKLTIPAGALAKNTTIVAGRVNNPPALPAGLNFVGSPIVFGPSGTNFSLSATLEIPFTNADLNFAGVSSKTGLKLYSFDEKTKVWSQEKIISIDTVKNIVIGQVNHFSFYSLVGLAGKAPDDLGKPQPGDILFTLTKYPYSTDSGWVPGHDGIYTGEKDYDGKSKASAEVIRCKKYNVVEALWSGVQYSYYKIPNTTQSCNTDAKFEDNSLYMGAREPKNFALTFEQRIKIVEFVEKQAGKPYVQGETYGVLFGMLNANMVKGPDNFNCVGLVEAAFEYAKTNNLMDYYQGLIPYDDIDTISPSMQYMRTKPAGGVDTVPVINFARMTPSFGLASTPVLIEVSVSHLYGLGQIDSVVYVTDDGYVNPAIEINDKGLSGDRVSGDGIYSTRNTIGGDSTRGFLGVTLTVTDKSGKSASTRIVFTYKNSGWIEVGL